MKTEDTKSYFVNFHSKTKMWRTLNSDKKQNENCRKKLVGRRYFQQKNLHFFSFFFSKVTALSWSLLPPKSDLKCHLIYEQKQKWVIYLFTLEKKIIAQNRIVTTLVNPKCSNVFEGKASNYTIPELRKHIENIFMWEGSTIGFDILSINEWKGR